MWLLTRITFCLRLLVRFFTVKEKDHHQSLSARSAGIRLRQREVQYLLPPLIPIHLLDIVVPMKTAKKFVRKVRSKSPFRRRKRADALIADVRDKEQAFAKELNVAGDHTSQPDDQAEIEVVLEFTSDVATASRTQSENSDSSKTPPPKEDAVLDLAPSSSTNMDAPPSTGPQAAARRFMERQQRLAAGNRRKSFRDRFMRPSYKNVSNPTLAPLEPPARSTKHMGISVRGRSRSASSFSSSGQGQGSVSRERGRSKERSAHGSLAMGSNAMSKMSPARSARCQATNRSFSIFGDKKDEPHKQQLLTNIKQKKIRTADQLSTIDVGNQSRISELSTPAAIIRQESLGIESIQGVRQALQKMEMELAQAGNAGKRVSRDKIMHALNYMANSLHFDDQREFAKELDAWIDESVIAGGDRTRIYDEEEDDDDDDNSDEESSTSDDDASGSTFDLEAFEDGGSASKMSVRKQTTQSSFQDLFLRLGKFFTISDGDKTAVKQALDDLLWTELAGSATASSLHSSKPMRDESDSSDDSIGNFDPLACNVHNPKQEPMAETRGRGWWRRHGIGIGSNRAKKENLHSPVQEAPPSPASKISVPSPTGKVNPRSSKSNGNGKSSGRVGGRSRCAGSADKSPRIAPPPLHSNEVRGHVPAAPLKKDESGSGWSSFDETASDFWRQGDRYTIQCEPKASTQWAQIANHYELSYPPSWQDNDSFLDSDFLDPPKEEDDWDNNCLHPAENLNHHRHVQN